jgi:hypothetical protein
MLREEREKDKGTTRKIRESKRQQRERGRE